MKGFIRIALLVILLIVGSTLFNSCSEGINIPTVNNTPAVAIVVSPDSLTMKVGESKHFTATMNGESNHPCIWSLLVELGTIDSTGTYTAPTDLPTYAMSVTVKATLKSDTTQFGYAKILIRQQ